MHGIVPSVTPLMAIEKLTPLSPSAASPIAPSRELPASSTYVAVVMPAALSGWQRAGSSPDAGRHHELSRNLMMFTRSRAVSIGFLPCSRICRYEQLDVPLFHVAIDSEMTGNSLSPAISFVPAESTVTNTQPDSQYR